MELNKILIIDYLDDSHELETILQNFGYETNLSKTIEEADKLITAQTFELVFLLISTQWNWLKLKRQIINISLDIPIVEVEFEKLPNGVDKMFYVATSSLKLKKPYNIEKILDLLENLEFSNTPKSKPQS